MRFPGALAFLGLLVVLPLAATEPAGFFARLFGATEVTSVASDTGGSNCAGCGIILGVVEQLAEYHNSSVEAALDKLCSYLGELKTPCQLLVNTYGEQVIEALEQKETPDVVCHAIGICKTPPGTEMCHIFPLPPSARQAPLTLSEHVQALQRRHKQRAQLPGRSKLMQGVDPAAVPKFCSWPVLEDICKIVEAWTGDNLPLDDADQDRYSGIETARGAAWRGKDCDDGNNNTYPGRRALNGDAVNDSNCNGIFGVDAATGRPYEEQWCNGTQRYGTVVLGDSVGAHFHIPPAWMNVTEMSEHAFENLLYILTNELDWPELSTGTGHYNATNWPYQIQGPMDSLYQRLLELNRCNHRDFQNVAVNGARSTAMADHIVKTLARHPAADQPLLVLFELVGNDVCNGHPGLGHMTPPQVFHDAQLTSLRYLDARLPAGSHVLLLGLVDGRFLYDNMHARVHPLGALRGDVTYAAVYDYLECLGVTPCWGWLNSNASARDATTAHAELLNAQLRDIVAKETFENFDLLYTPFNISAAAEVAAKHGKQPWQLIEPVDGFHSNQLSNALTTSVLWDLIAAQKPGWLPAANPHNADIVAKFGDQGGY